MRKRELFAQCKKLAAFSLGRHYNKIVDLLARAMFFVFIIDDLFERKIVKINTVEKHNAIFLKFIESKKIYNSEDFNIIKKELCQLEEAMQQECHEEDLSPEKCLKIREKTIGFDFIDAIIEPLIIKDKEKRLKKKQRRIISSGMREINNQAEALHPEHSGFLLKKLLGKIKALRIEQAYREILSRLIMGIVTSYEKQELLYR